MSAQLLPLQTQVALQRASMFPQLRQAQFGFTTTPFQLVSNLLSGATESAATGQSSGFGFGLPISVAAGG